MQDRPTVDELLEAIGNYLVNDVMPNTTGRVSFHARVANNAVQIIRRELAGEEEHLAAEWNGLDGLLGAEARPTSLRELRAAVMDRNAALVDRIRAGDADSGPFRAAVIAHLKRSTRDKLSVTNPGWLQG